MMTTTSDGFRRGDNIEARYKGKSKWYKGSISRVNANGTYDILYDDGDTERGVRESLFVVVNVQHLQGARMQRGAARILMTITMTTILMDIKGAITSKLDTNVNQSGTRGPFRE